MCNIIAIYPFYVAIKPHIYFYDYSQRVLQDVSVDALPA
jgi:hypothetical protein